MFDATKIYLKRNWQDMWTLKLAVLHIHHDRDRENIRTMWTFVIHMLCDEFENDCLFYSSRKKPMLRESLWFISNFIHHKLNFLFTSYLASLIWKQPDSIDVILACETNLRLFENRSSKLITWRRAGGRRARTIAPGQRWEFAQSSEFMGVMITASYDLFTKSTEKKIKSEELMTLWMCRKMANNFIFIAL